MSIRLQDFIHREKLLVRVIVIFTYSCLSFISLSLHDNKREVAEVDSPLVLNDISSCSSQSIIGAKFDNGFSKQLTIILMVMVFS